MTDTDSERLTRYRELAHLEPDYAFLIAQLDRIAEVNERLNARVIGLLDANNKLVSERNVARGRADHYASSVDWLLRHNGVEQLRRLQTENRILTEERNQARHEMRQAWAQAEINLDASYRIKTDGPIAEAARVFFQRLNELKDNLANSDTSAMAVALLTAYEDLRDKVNKGRD